MTFAIGGINQFFQVDSKHCLMYCLVPGDKSTDCEWYIGHIVIGRMVRDEQVNNASGSPWWPDDESVNRRHEQTKLSIGVSPDNKATSGVVELCWIVKMQSSESLRIACLLVGYRDQWTALCGYGAFENIVALIIIKTVACTRLTYRSADIPPAVI